MSRHTKESEAMDMKVDYVYGDLQLKVTLDAAETTIFANLTSGETLALGQWLYLALNCFSNTRALHLLDLVEQEKKTEEIRTHDANTLDGG